MNSERIMVYTFGVCGVVCLLAIGIAIVAG